MAFLRANEKDFEKKLRAFVGTGEASTEVSQTVTAIIDDVKARGDIAVLYHTARLDHAKLNIRQIRVPEEHLKRAVDSLSPEKKKSFWDF